MTTKQVGHQSVPYALTTVFRFNAGYVESTEQREKAEERRERKRKEKQRKREGQRRRKERRKEKNAALKEKILKLLVRDE